MDDDQTNFLLNWTYLYQEKSMDEATQSLLLTMELQEAKLKAENDLKSRDQQILHLKNLLSTAIEERDKAQENCRKMLLEKALLQKQLQRQSAPHSAVSSIEDDPSDESIVSSPDFTPAEGEPDSPVAVDRPLPEKGKLLEAVMKAGPLLQTLLVAGPLPRWRHPPPPVDAYLIPPPPLVVPPSSLPMVSTHFLHQDSFNKCGRINRKRGAIECSEKYQSVVLR